MSKQSRLNKEKAARAKANQDQQQGRQPPQQAEQRPNAQQREEIPGRRWMPDESLKDR